MNDYLKTKRALSIDEMELIRQVILEEIDGDEEGTALFRRLLAKSIRYTSIRAGWGLLSAEEKADADEGRTAAHDSIITHFNMLSRYLENKGKDISWRETLGDISADPYNRKRIGDMAGYLVFAESLMQR